MLSSIGRAAIRRGGAGASFASTNRAAQIFNFLRVNASQITNETNNKPQLIAATARSYATATKTVVKTKTTRTTKAKPKAKVKKSAKKPAKKKKVAKKAKAKKPKKLVRKPKKVLTEEEKKKIQLRLLKQKALLTQPTKLPYTSWSVYLNDAFKAQGGSVGGTEALGATVLSVSARYKALAPADLESLKLRAEANKVANEIAFKKWVESHTPEQIKNANNARTLLKRKTGKTSSFPPIHDARLPKRPLTPWAAYNRDRQLSGDFKGVELTEATKRIAAEWKALSAAQKKPFEDDYKADKQRYSEEYKTVYHKDLPTA